MIRILEAAFFGFILLTVVYWLVAIYSRSVRRERLEKEFDAGGVEGSRDDHIDRGLEAYENGLRRKLIVLVYIIPMVLVAVTVYFVDYQ
jgi:hypothetical protein